MKNKKLMRTTLCILQDLHCDVLRRTTRERIIKRYGEDAYRAFDRLCIEPNGYAAHTIDGYVIITQKGIDYFFHLQEVAHSQRFNRAIISFTLLTAITSTVSLAINPQVPFALVWVLLIAFLIIATAFYLSE